MAFLSSSSGQGPPWGEALRGAAAAADERGRLCGRWGECLVAAVRYEFEHADYGEDPAFRDEGPAGQVIAALCERFGPGWADAADSLERLTMQALVESGGVLQPGPSSPDAWREGACPSSSSSSSGKGGGDAAAAAALLDAFGLRRPLPWRCCMNDAVERAGSTGLPEEALAALPEGLHVLRRETVSDGWHEGYLLHLSAPIRPGHSPKVILRIWRSQLAYARLEVAMGAGVELRAMALARAAGLPAPTCLRPDGVAPFAGTCARPEHGEACDWAVIDFVDHASGKVAAKAMKKAGGHPQHFLLGTMAKLHALDLRGVDTAPIPRFETWREQIDYLAAQAAESGLDDALRAVEGARTMLEAAAAPPLPPALCHLDWHMGNVLCDAAGGLLAVIDWEFACICDPRLDVARFCRQELWTGERSKAPRPEEEADGLWRRYAAARFGGDADAALQLGPREPWLALESAVVLAVGAAACALAAQVQSGAPDARVPRCDLEEWSEDMAAATFQLRRLGIL